MLKFYFIFAVAALVIPVDSYAALNDPNQPAQLSDIVVIIANIISLLAPVAGIAFFVMLLFGGYQFITSGGDPKAAAGARNTLTYAILGIILVVGVWLLLALIKAVTNVDVTTVTFPL